MISLDCTRPMPIRTQLSVDHFDCFRTVLQDYLLSSKVNAGIVLMTKVTAKNEGGLDSLYYVGVGTGSFSDVESDFF